MVLSLAPSFIADFAVSGLEDLQGIFKAMGFAWAEETAVGAQIVTREYQRMVDQKEQDIIITTCCHTVNTLIQRYYPQAIPYMAHTLSPMLAHAKYIKERHPGAMVVFAGPCLSKKAEAEQYGYVDCVLTFDELRDWMEETQAAVPGLELPPPLTPEEQGRRSRSYPISGGILKTMKPEDTGYDYIVVDGVRSCMDAPAGDRGGRPPALLYRDERLQGQLRGRPRHAPVPQPDAGGQHGQGGAVCGPGSRRL